MVASALAITIAIAVAPPGFVFAQSDAATPMPTAQWLHAHPEDPRWPDVFKAFLRASPGLPELRSAVEGFAAAPKYAGSDLALDIAGLLEVSGSMEAAMIYYARAASEASSPETRMRALLASAALASDLGQGDAALASLQTAISSATDAAQRAGLRVLRALVQYDLGPRDQAVAELQDVLPLLEPAGLFRLHALFALAIHYQQASVQDKAELFRRQLQATYPGSPEAAIVASTSAVTLAPTPRRLLRAVAPSLVSQPPVQPPAVPTQGAPPPAQSAPPPAPSAPAVRIQAGSFTVAENAAFMVKDLEKAGFDAAVDRVVVGGRTYFRVMLAQPLSTEEARLTMTRLKQAGFEGAILP